MFTLKKLKYLKNSKGMRLSTIEIISIALFPLLAIRNAKIYEIIIK
jgi:hypothetical protein